ncbi:MAG: Lpg1974 family pore-forming outer membrane protein [Chlamydiota bacterium]
MYRNFKMMQSVAAASLLTAISVVHAADDAQMRNLENRVAALEQRKSANGMINPNGRPQIRDGADVFVTADFLYWIGNESGLGFVVKNGTNAGFVDSGKLVSPHFKYEPGFRLGLGYNLPHDGWDVYADWTWLISRADRHVTPNSGGNLFPTIMNLQEIDSISTQISSANAHWKTHLNIIDLELGRQFFVSKWLTLRPHFGLRTAWVNQDYKQNYHGSFNVIRPSPIDLNVPGTLYSEEKCKFWGIGLRGGLNNQWGMGHGFSLFGDLAASLLFGRFHIDEDQNFKPTGLVSFNVFNEKSKFTACRAIVDLGAGLRWGQYFNRDRFYFRLQAGWEQHMFFSQNQFLRVVDDFIPGITVSNQGDLSYNGLTISALFAF